MTYQVLARKWRPGKFSDLVGQSHVLKPLTHALDNERLHHAYLFTGTRGVGKTTLARILARCLNCEQGVSSDPCGTCGACTEITEGRFIDLIEVDAASRTKVEDTRELLENVQYAPTMGRFKIYLIDEVHMLSTHSFNALLKTLEEPPPHVKFLLATTDPQKLPVTILSRCLQFNLKNLNPQQIEEYLEQVLQQENIEFEEAALWQIASAAAGSMRDALTLMDQAISFCEGTVGAAGVSEMIGTPDQGTVFQLLESLANQDSAGILQTVQDIAERGTDLQQLLEALLSTLHRLAIAQVLPDGIDNSFGDREQVLDFAERFSAEDLQLYYQIGLKGRADLSLALDIRAMFEMLLIRMLVFSPAGVPTMPQKSGQGEKQDKRPDSDQGSADKGLSAAEQKKKPLKADSAVPDKPNNKTARTSAPPEQQKSRSAANAAAVEQAQPEPTAPDKPAKQTAESSALQTQQESKAAADSASVVKTKTSAKSKSETKAKGTTELKAEAETIAAEEAETKSTKQKQPANKEPVSPGPEKKLKKKSTVKADQEAIALPESATALNDRNWIVLCQHLNPGGITGNILAHCVIISATPDSLELCLDTAQSAVHSEEHRERIEQLLANHFKQALRVAIAIGEPATESPAAYNQRLKREAMEQLRSDFQQDDNVQKLVETFSGEVLQESIAPPGQ